MLVFYCAVFCNHAGAWHRSGAIHDIARMHVMRMHINSMTSGKLSIFSLTTVTWPRDRQLLIFKRLKAPKNWREKTLTVYHHDHSIFHQFSDQVLNYCCLQWLAKERPTLNQLWPKRLLCLKEERRAFVNCVTTTLETGPLASVTIPPVYDAPQSYVFSVNRKSAPSADWPSKRCAINIAFTFGPSSRLWWPATLVN